MVGENLGNVPREIYEALPRHRIWGMYLAEFQAPDEPEIPPPTAMDVALVGTHDTPTFAGWLTGNDIAERVRYGLLPSTRRPASRRSERERRSWLAERLNSCVDEPRAFLAELLDWLGRSDSSAGGSLARGPLAGGARGESSRNPSSDRPNWQCPMSRLLDEIFRTRRSRTSLRRLDQARQPVNSLALDLLTSRPIMASAAAPRPAVRAKPRLSFWEIWNMSFGFLGIQVGFALQNANVSRIFETLGAKVDDIPLLWIAAPVTGLLVQPVVGYFSDRTWNRLGRRRPYFLGGAILASLALVFMPNSPALWIAAGMLWIMDASINISMEPFRAFVGDNLPVLAADHRLCHAELLHRHRRGRRSMLPWLLTEQFGVSNEAPPHMIPDSVRLSFYFGAAVFFLAVLWTVSGRRNTRRKRWRRFAENQAREGTAGSGERADEFAANGRRQIRLGSMLLLASAVRC